MSIKIDIIAVIILLGIIQGYFLAIVLFNNRNGNYEANRYLAMLLCAISTAIVNIFLLQTDLHFILFYTSKFSAFIILLFGPLFFFYVRSLIYQVSRLQHYDLLHFIPALLIFYRFIPYYLADNTTKESFILSPLNFKAFKPEHYEFLTIIIFSQIHLWIYLFIVLHLLKQYRQCVKEYYSNIERHNLNWIRFFISLFAMVYIVFLIASIIMIKYNYKISFNLLGITVSLAIFILGYHGLKQTALITITTPKPLKQESTELSPELIRSLTTQLNILMNEEKLFTNPDLNLDDLAKKLNISRNSLSQFINEYLQTNFFDYINGFRVEEMKRLLIDTEKEYMTIYALAVEAGFSAKSTYNRIFKQLTGMTPSEFRQKHCRRKIKGQKTFDSYQINESNFFLQD